MTTGLSLHGKEAKTRGVGRVNPKAAWQRRASTMWSPAPALKNLQTWVLLPHAS